VSKLAEGLEFKLSDFCVRVECQQKEIHKYLENEKNA
jgi:hypothetical protein